MGYGACDCPEDGACLRSAFFVSGSLQTSMGNVEYVAPVDSATFSHRRAADGGCATAATVELRSAAGGCRLQLEFGANETVPGGLRKVVLTVDDACGAGLSAMPGDYVSPEGYGLLSPIITPALVDGSASAQCTSDASVTFAPKLLSLEGPGGATLTVNLGGLTLQGNLFSNGDANAQCPQLDACGPGFEPMGNTWCSPSSCETGFHDGGDGECVPVGTCSQGYRLAGGVCLALVVDCAEDPPIADAGADQTVGPDVLVTLDGSASIAPRGGRIFDWRLIGQPAGSSVVLSSATAIKPTFTPTHEGEYTAELVVRDVDGCESKPSRVNVRVDSQPRSIELRLTWNSTHGDVDLHYLAPQGLLYDYFITRSDCFALNRTPDWGKNGGFGADKDPTNDPVHEGDVNWGSGPEVIRHDKPFDGTFNVVVHNYCTRKKRLDGTYESASWGAVTTHLRILVDGEEVLSRWLALTQRQLWEAATITVSEGGTKVEVTPGSSVVTSTNKDFGGCTADTF